MKRTKLLLSSVVSFLLAFVMVFAVACNNGNNNDDKNTNDTDYGISDSSKDNLALDHISVRDYTETFKLGTPFSTGNLVVSATLNDYGVSDKAMTEVDLKPGEYQVDSSDYNANRVGVYTIYVSYTRANVTRTAHYSVSVVSDEPEYGGIIVKIADGKSNSVSLTADSATVTVTKDIVAVYAIGANGEAEEEPLHEDLYNADLYLGSTKIENNTTDKGGVYSLVVSLKADPTKQDFISIYVVNPVTKIEHVEGVGTYEQEASSKDVISGTWQFTVTYANGVTKTVKAGDAGLTIELDTKVAGNGKTATVKYVEVDASGSEKEVTTTVTYTITAKEVSGSVNYKVTYDVDSDDNSTGKWTTTWANNVEDSEGTIVFNASALDGYKSGKKTSADGTYSAEHAFEFKSNKNLLITVGAAATNVTIDYFVSHGTANDSNRTASVTKDGNTVVSVKPEATADAAPGLYKMTVENATAGTYTLTADNTMRVYYVEITYTVEGSTGGDVLPATITVTADDVTGYPADGILTADLAWGNSEILKVLTGCKVNSSKKKVDGVDIQNRLQTAGAATTSGKAIEIDLTGSEYNGLVAHVRVVFYAGSADMRYLQVLDISGSEYTAGTKPTENRTTSDQFDETVNLAGGAKYYLGGSNGINIYKVVITFEKA